MNILNRVLNKIETFWIPLNALSYLKHTGQKLMNLVVGKMIEMISYHQPSNLVKQFSLLSLEIDVGCGGFHKWRFTPSLQKCPIKRVE